MFLKISVHLQASIHPFTWTVVTGPTSYLSKNFELPNVGQVKSHIQAVRDQIVPLSRLSIYFFSLAGEAACPPYLLNLFLISSNLFPCLLWLNFECWLTCQICRFSCKSATATFCIIFPTFLRTGISSDFTWIFIDWLSAGFLPGVLSPWPNKKRHRKMSRQKMFLQT